MKKIISALLLLNLVFACKPKSEEVEPVAETGCRQLSYKETLYNGTVAANEVYSYNSAKKLIELKGLDGVEVYEYNAKGLRVRKTVSRPSHSDTQVEEYLYDDKDRLIKEIRGWQNNSAKDYLLYEYHSNGALRKREYYVYVYGGLYTSAQYNEQGLVVLEEGPYGLIVKYEYNAGGKVIRRIQHLQPPSTSITDETVEYNSKNLPVKITSRVDGVLTGFIIYEYDDKGREISFYSTSVLGEVFSKKTTVYNGENYSVANYYRNELADRTEYEVLNSRIMKKTYYRKDVFQYSDTYAYDASGNMIRDEMKLSYQANPVIREWAYACD